MDIAGLSMGLAQNATMSKVGTAVLSKALEAQETEGAQLVKMIDAAQMERSVNPYVGGNFDMSV
ncbi:MAG: YjfB family protein [Lachnospiraceae bacterium]|nr:YjfB family protein [Lachnospiraceae bacterium]